MGRHRTLEERIEDLERRIARIRASERARAERKERGRAPGSQGPRFSPAWVSSQRRKLGLSAADFGRLVGVSGLTIYNWEKGKARPRRKQLEALAAVRGFGMREVRRRLGSEPRKPTRRRARKA